MVTATIQKDDLMTVFNFTYADLQANRSGYLTPEQSARVTRKTTLRDALQSALVLVGLPLLVVLGVLMLNSGTTGPLGLVILIGAVVVFFGMVRDTLRRFVRLFGRVEWPVSVVSGRVNIIRSKQNGVELLVDGRYFRITEQAAAVFNEGRPYVVYYIANPRLILSVEALG